MSTTENTPLVASAQQQLRAATADEALKIASMALQIASLRATANQKQHVCNALEHVGRAVNA